MDILHGYLFSYTYLFATILLIGLIQKIIKFDIEISRKVIHIFVGMTWLILQKYLEGTWHIVIVPLSFVIINALSYKYKIFKMYERADGSGNHFGTVYYAVSMTVMAVISLFIPKLMLPFGIACFSLSFGDGAAALAGSLIKKKKIMITREKSLAGTMMCAIFAALGIALLSCFVSLPLKWTEIVLLGVLTAVLELVGKGLDNFSIPFGVMAASALLLG